MRKDSGCFRRKDDRIFSGGDRYGIAHEICLLRNGGTKLVIQPLKLVEAGRALLPCPRELLFAFRHAAREGQSAGLIIICDIRSETGLKAEQAVAVKI